MKQAARQSQWGQTMGTIRWGLVGCGDVARKRVARALIEAPDSRLVAACRRDPARLAAFCAQFSVERQYTDPYALIDDPALDAVYLATPVCEHLPHTLAAARAGKHVLVEKPMGLTVSECDQMITACRAANVRLGVAYYRRFYPLVSRMQALIERGEIGIPMSISATTATPFAIAPGSEGYWRVVPDVGGGGALMDIGCHRIDIFQHFFGPITEVHGLTATLAADYPVEDSAVLVVRFARGQLGTLQCHFGSTADPDECAILGTRGRLVARPLNGDTLIWENERKFITEKHPAPANLCGPLVADFVRAIQTGIEPLVSGAEGRATSWVMEQAYQMAR